MKRKLFIAVCAAMAFLLASCSPVSTADDSSQTVTSAATSSQESSADTASQASSIPVSSAPASSKAVSSAPPSSQAASSASQASSKPVESKQQVSSKPPAKVSSDPPTSSKTETPPVKQTNPPASSAAIPDDERPMTDAEVDALIQEGIAYAESLGMTWDDTSSIEKSGYNPPAQSDFGYDSCKKKLLYEIDIVYQGAVNSSRYVEGNYIYYKIEKGKIENFDGWFLYVLY